MTLEELLAEFGTRHMGRPLVLDDNDVCLIDYDSGRRLAMEPVDESDKVWIYAFVGRPPAYNADVAYHRLMTAHLFGAMTADAWFAVDAMAEEIVLNRCFTTTHMDVDDFDSLIAEFMDRVDHWTHELSDAQADRPAEDPSEFTVRV